MNMKPRAIVGRMKTIPLLLLFSASCWAQSAFGVWTIDPARSKLTGQPHLRVLAVRFEAHPKGEVFTLDTVDRNGRAATNSVILYLDGKSRDFQDASCTGTQSSRRLDNRTVEIVFNCGKGQPARFIRRTQTEPNELILNITDRVPGGRTIEHHLILKRQ
jgi:hypothetical protein